MSYADPSEIEATPYVAGDIANLVARLRETRDAARMRSRHGTEALRQSVICDFDSLEHTVASQIEMLCSRLSEAAQALEERYSPHLQGQQNEGAES